MKTAAKARPTYDDNPHGVNLPLGDLGKAAPAKIPQHKREEWASEMAEAHSLKPSEAAVLFHIASMAGSSDLAAWPSTHTLSRRTRFTLRTIGKATKELSRLGLIRVRRRQRKSNVYHIILDAKSVPIKDNLDAKSVPIKNHPDTKSVRIKDNLDAKSVRTNSTSYKRTETREDRTTPSGVVFSIYEEKIGELGGRGKQWLAEWEEEYGADEVAVCIQITAEKGKGIRYLGGVLRNRRADGISKPVERNTPNKYLADYERVTGRPYNEDRDASQEEILKYLRAARESGSEASDYWNAVLGEMQMQLPSSAFATWLKDTAGLSFADGKLVVGVPNVFTSEWLERRAYQLVQRTASKVVGVPIDVIFRIGM